MATGFRCLRTLSRGTLKRLRMVSDLDLFIESLLSGLAPRVGSSLSVGIEQDFFVLEHDCSTASEARVRTFFDAFESTSLDQEGFPRARLVGRSGARHQLKPEHWPHLLEVAFAPLPIERIESEVASVFALLQASARRCSLEIHFRTSIDPSQLRPHSDSVPRSQARLAKSRTVLARAAGHRGDAAFTGNLASTQVSVGGFRWWEGSVLDHLYALEPQVEEEVLGLAAADRTTLRQWRTLEYLRVFDGLELLLFPDFERNWFLSWAASIVGQPQSFWAEARGADLPVYERLMTSRRDLSLIRPRHFGPIEFRGGPCLETASAIGRVAEKRVLQVTSAMASDTAGEAVDLAQARRSWVSRLPAACARIIEGRP